MWNNGLLEVLGHYFTYFFFFLGGGVLGRVEFLSWEKDAPGKRTPSLLENPFWKQGFGIRVQRSKMVSDLLLRPKP